MVSSGNRRVPDQEELAERDVGPEHQEPEQQLAEVVEVLDVDWPCGSRRARKPSVTRMLSANETRPRSRTAARQTWSSTSWLEAHEPVERREGGCEREEIVETGAMR